MRALHREFTIRDMLQNFLSRAEQRRFLIHMDFRGAKAASTIHSSSSLKWLTKCEFLQRSQV